MQDSRMGGCHVTEGLWEQRATRQTSKEPRTTFARCTHQACSSELLCAVLNSPAQTGTFGAKQSLTRAQNQSTRTERASAETGARPTKCGHQPADHHPPPPPASP
jgi:hypothetical protein